MSPHHTTCERARWGGHVSTSHYRREGEVGEGGGVMSLHHTTGERAM